MGKVADISFLSNPFWTVTRVLVGIDLFVGLAEDMEIMIGDSQYSQTLEYDRIPLQCVCFHMHGYVVAKFPQPFVKTVWQRKGFQLKERILDTRVGKGVSLGSTEVVMPSSPTVCNVIEKGDFEEAPVQDV